ncbi:cytochrome P450 [Nocardia sp. NPDC057455]|uniref:cytochrome P450 n=1 Tax=Nocardia sp. NPDC057455 TaxID=3346138 RepID=UPI003672F5E3
MAAVPELSAHGRARRRIPRPPGRPLVGDLAAYQHDPIGWMVGARVAYGDVVQLAPGIVVLFDPDATHRVLSETNVNYVVDSGRLAGARSRRERLSRLSTWKLIRRDLWHGFDSELVDAHVRRYREWMGGADLDRDAGLVDVCRDLCGRGIVDFYLGGDRGTAALVTEIRAAADQLFARSLETLDRAEARVRWWPRPHAARADSANQRLVELLGEVIRQRAAERRSAPARDALDVLLAACGGVADDGLLGTLRMALFASHGVPGVALSWLLLRLAADAGLRTRVLDELDGDPMVTGSVATDIPYTMAVIRETLRLHPPQWILSRTAVQDTEIGGYRVKAGWEVVMCPYLLHRDPGAWAEPERFDPGRWLNATPHPRHSYLPFGSGTRICPGSQLGILQMVSAVQQLFTHYELSLPQFDTVTPAFTTLLHPANVTPGWHRRPEHRSQGGPTS